MTVTLTATDLAIAQRLAALVCSAAWKGEVNTLMGFNAFLAAGNGKAVHGIVDGLGGVTDWGATMDYVEHQRRQWWRLMGMASRPWGEGDGA